MRDDVTNKIVLDASVALSWCFEDERTPAADLLLSRAITEIEFLVPSLWPLEVANALHVAERRGRIRHFWIAELFSILLDLPILLEPNTSQYVFDRIFAVAHRTHLSIYDASYLELALARKLPLATLDQALLKAARQLGVQLWNE